MYGKEQKEQNIENFSIYIENQKGEKFQKWPMKQLMHCGCEFWQREAEMKFFTTYAWRDVKHNENILICYICTCVVCLQKPFGRFRICFHLVLANAECLCSIWWGMVIVLNGWNYGNLNGESESHYTANVESSQRVSKFEGRPT